MDRHTCAETLRVSSLVELCVRHRDSGLVLTYGTERLTEKELVLQSDKLNSLI